MNLDEIFAETCKGSSDINEHLPLLRELASRCDHVTEFGTRWANGSTIAFLAAQPKTFVAWDLNADLMVSQQIKNLWRLRGKTDFQPRVGDTLKITIEPTDLLFIDTLHTAKQLLRELERHCAPSAQAVRKYLVFHDTETFGVVGEDGQPPGLRAAILQFQKFFAFPLWKLVHADDDEALQKAAQPGLSQRQALYPGEPLLLDLRNNNGLIVLEHVCAQGHSPERTKGNCQWCGQVPRAE